MTELKLYKFINDNAIEWHISYNNNHEDVVVFIPFDKLEEFTKLAKDTMLDEAIECHMRTSYIAVWMKGICEFYDIELDNVFQK